jgi:hypothetical protein
MSSHFSLPQVFGTSKSGKSRWDAQSYGDTSLIAEMASSCGGRVPVRDYVVKKGVETGRVSGQGFGESKPIADNKTAEGRAKNRRVEIKVN